MTDINRLITSLKRRTAHAKEFGDSITFVKLKDIDALVEALEVKEEQRANWFQMAQKLGEDLDAAEKRISELESRPVTVKLPEIERPIDGTGYAKAAGAQYYKECVIKELTAQGIKWEAE